MTNKGLVWFQRKARNLLLVLDRRLFDGMLGGAWAESLGILLAALAESELRRVSDELAKTAKRIKLGSTPPFFQRGQPKTANGAGGEAAG